MRGGIVLRGLVFLLMLFAPVQALASGFFTTYDERSLSSGFDIYRKVCGACEALRFLRFRHLEQAGMTRDEIDALLSEYRLYEGDIDYSDLSYNDTIPPVPASIKLARLPDDLYEIKILKTKGETGLLDELRELEGFNSEEELVDVVNFIGWASDPAIRERKKIGLAVLVYLLILTFVNLKVHRRIEGKPAY